MSSRTPASTKKRSLLDGSFRALGGLVCLFTLLPVLRRQSWWIRVFDFPRVQVCALGGAVLGYQTLRRKRMTRSDRWIRKLVQAAMAAQLMQIFPYTPLARKQVIRGPVASREPGERLSLLVANVRMRNRETDELRKLVSLRNPDVVLLLEPDHWWCEQLTALEEGYPYRLAYPQGNTYGELLYSKLPLLEPEVRFLVQPDVPSIRTLIQLPNHRQVCFYGLHPKPPGRLTQRGEIRSSGPRDAELIVVAKELENCTTPVIVAGDFNDVAWSHTTRRFQRLANLLDPRVGRGFYSTYHAEYPLFRFPVDHLFHSEHFVLNRFQRERSIGSDHFPIYAELIFEPEAAEEQKIPRASRTDHQEKQETVAEHAAG